MVGESFPLEPTPCGSTPSAGTPRNAPPPSPAMPGRLPASRLRLQQGTAPAPCALKSGRPGDGGGLDMLRAPAMPGRLPASRLRLQPGTAPALRPEDLTPCRGRLRAPGSVPPESRAASPGTVRFEKWPPWGRRGFRRAPRHSIAHPAVHEKMGIPEGPSTFSLRTAGVEMQPSKRHCFSPKKMFFVSTWIPPVAVASGWLWGMLRIGRVRGVVYL